MKAYAGHTGVQVNHTTHCAAAERRMTEREICREEVYCCSVPDHCRCPRPRSLRRQLRRIHLQPLRIGKRVRFCNRFRNCLGTRKHLHRGNQRKRLRRGNQRKHHLRRS